MLGQLRPRLVKTDLRAVESLARYARLIARAHVLRLSGASFQNFRTIAAPGFYCRLGSIPFDQTSQPVKSEVIDSDGCGIKGVVGATLLRLEFWPVRLLLLGRTLSDGRLQWQHVRGGSSLTSREAVAAAEAFIAGGEQTEPHLTIHLRNRGAAQPLSDERRKTQRRILNLHELKADPHLRFLCVRSIYVGELSSHDDLKSQIALALLQAGILERDSLVAGWFCNDYLYCFLPRRVRVGGREVIAQVCAKAFLGLWKNWGNAERAQAWRVLVMKWVRQAAYGYLRQNADPAWLKQPDVDEDDEAKRVREEAWGALGPHRKQKRDVGYALPPSEDGRVSGPQSIENVASALGVSVRHVYRLIRAGRLRSARRNPIMLDPVEVDNLAREGDVKRAFRNTRLKEIEHLIHESDGKLGRDSARKAEYRARTRVARQSHV